MQIFKEAEYSSTSPKITSHVVLINCHIYVKQINITLKVQIYKYFIETLQITRQKYDK